MGKYMVDADMPMDTEHGPLHFTDGTLAYAGLHLHVEGHPMHTQRFVEVAFVVGGLSATTYRKHFAAKAAHLLEARV